MNRNGDSAEITPLRAPAGHFATPVAEADVARVAEKIFSWWEQQSRR